MTNGSGQGGDTDSRKSVRHEFETLLTRVIINLSYLAQGHDDELDLNLASLRESLKTGITPALKPSLRGVVSGMEGLPRDLSLGARHPLARLLNRMPFNRGDALRANELARAINARPPLEINDEDIDRVVELLVSVRTGAADASAEAAPIQSVDLDKVDANGVLRELLQRLTWPDRWRDQIASYCGGLRGGAESDEWVRVLTDLSQLMLSTLSSAESEVRDAENFLTNLTKQLAEMDQFLLGGTEKREAALESSRAFGKEVTEEVGSIAGAFARKLDFPQLKEEVGIRLKVIKGSVNRHLTEYEKRIQEDEVREQSLVTQLESLEKESGDLRRRIMQARHQALLDGLTQVPNRMAYDERVQQEHARWRRFREPVTMLVWDLDDFKVINDRFGHQSGDKALKAVAAALKSNIRETDFVARYGGEEFVMLLIGANGTNALPVAEKIRRQIAGLAFHSGSTRVNLTISCGMTEFREDETPADAFARADKALYLAKSQGKNCCVLD